MITFSSNRRVRTFRFAVPGIQRTECVVERSEPIRPSDPEFKPLEPDMSRVVDYLVLSIKTFRTGGNRRLWKEQERKLKKVVSRLQMQGYGVFMAELQRRYA